MITVPCKDCTDRNLGCHSTCGQYIRFKQEKEQEAQTRREILDFEWSIARNRIERAKKRNRR